MTDFTIRGDHVDVEQIMRQIRTRIKEKRGVDYTEEEVRELASVKLEKFLNPRAVRSELVEYYRRKRPSLASLPPPPDNFAFEDHTIYDSHRIPWLGRLRRWLNPILKLFFNPNPVIQALHLQGRMNTHILQQFDRITATREELDTLNFEVLNNIVLEVTRLGIEVKNLRMQIESMNARQEFGERRSRAVEGLLAEPAAPGGGPAPREPAGEGEDPEARSRRRRRRRGRRRQEGDPASGRTSGPEGPAGEPSSSHSGAEPDARADGSPPPGRPEPDAEQ